MRYELTGETKQKHCCTLHRVRWLADNREGGWITDEKHLPQDGSGVLYGDAEVYGGTIRGGTIRGGTIWGGTIWGGTFYGTPCQATRHDGYVFTAKVVEGELRIWAGCRDFSWAEAVTHWNDNHRHGAESQRIIHFLKAQAEAEAIRDAAK